MLGTASAIPPLVVVAAQITGDAVKDALPALKRFFIGLGEQGCAAAAVAQGIGVRCSFANIMVIAGAVLV